MKQTAMSMKHKVKGLKQRVKECSYDTTLGYASKTTKHHFEIPQVSMTAELIFEIQREYYSRNVKYYDLIDTLINIFYHYLGTNASHVDIK